jgi:hypothetical protein
MALLLSGSEARDAGLLLRVDREWFGGQRRAQFPSEVGPGADSRRSALQNASDLLGKPLYFLSSSFRQDICTGCKPLAAVSNPKLLA